MIEWIMENKIYKNKMNIKILGWVGGKIVVVDRVSERRRLRKRERSHDQVGEKGSVRKG